MIDNNCFGTMIGSTKMENIIIREIAPNELFVLEDMLYEAIYQLEDADKLPREIIRKPEISLYTDDFGSKSDDYCLVADLGGKIIGAVWIRILADEVKGYGNIDKETPEFAISLFKEYRNKGVGTLLMENMIEYLKEKGYKQASLSVDKNNYAAKMYKSLGFEVIRENEHDFLMLLKLR